MAIGHVVTRGFGNGSLVGTIGLVVTRGYLAAEIDAVPDSSSLEWADISDELHYRIKDKPLHWRTEGKLEYRTT